MGYSKAIVFLVAIAIGPACKDPDQAAEVRQPKDSVETVTNPGAELARKILILDAALKKLEAEVADLRKEPAPNQREIAEREAKIEALEMTLRQSRAKQRTLGME